MAETRETSSNFIGRVIDYLFGRNALIGIASLMLLAISGYATWSGMNDFIVGVSTSPAARGREIPGGLSVSNEALVIAIVVALTFLMWLSLRESFASSRRWRDRLLTFPLYVFLALWSIGFGYGFWWSLIAGEEATRKGLSGLQEDARDAGAVVAARLEAVKIQLDSVVQWSDGQMAREETSGGSCGVSSGAGRGPLYNARRSVRDSVSSLRDSVETSWLAPVQVDLGKLRAAASKLEGATVEERQQSFESMARTIRGSARSIAARSNQLGQSTASEMRALANAVSIKPGQTGFSCYDPTLAQRLNQAAKQAAEPAVLDLRPAAFSEGPAGVANAVKSLWTNIGSYVSGLVAYIASGGAGSSVATADGEPISGRDLIALLATLGIDLGLFVLTALNPPRTPPDRQLPGPLRRQIVDAIRTAIKRAPDASWEWVRQHFLHHKTVSYFVIPNMYSCDTGRPGEKERALAMNQLAGVLGDLGLVRVLKTSELKALGQDEQRGSYTDLTPYRHEWRKRQGTAAENALKLQRNHGLLSKAERALEIARWSEDARSDVEIFKLVDREGLTPLLAVLNDPGQVLEGADQPKDKLVAAEDIKLLPVPETHKRYLERICDGAAIDAAARPVVERIARNTGRIESALRDLFATYPPIAQKVQREREDVANQVSQTNAAIIETWAADDETTYPYTKIPTVDIQQAAAIYRVLKTVRDSLKRLIPETGAAKGADQRTSTLRAASSAIDRFLDPHGGGTVDAVVETLEEAAMLNVV